jgi:MerR family redox-sensitive transcriptional activator SoxR
MPASKRVSRPLPEWITIGELAGRSGVAPSALRFYETLGLITSERNPANQRRYSRAVLRRVAVIRAAQGLGLSLREIAQALDDLPGGRTPTPEDWEAMARRWHDELEQRIVLLQRLRDDLSSCIGCGCLSLDRCALFNKDDEVSAEGPGPRILIRP